MSKTKVAIIGPGNISTDLMIKVLRHSDVLDMGAMVGIDPESDGLGRARRMNVPTTSDGVDRLIAMEGFAEIGIGFDQPRRRRMSPIANVVLRSVQHSDPRHRRCSCRGRG